MAQHELSKKSESTVPYIPMNNGNETSRPPSTTHVSAQDTQHNMSSSNESLAGTPSSWTDWTEITYSTDQSDKTSDCTESTGTDLGPLQIDLLLEVGAWASVSLPSTPSLHISRV
ncbi:hypothetical protein F4781DRAFT_438140 [Annulohypoxylon bovei var. microspora]|nr:hypothetical protein F4781DRAFT_438140 [Annulohypoxylon bovei var. microspora]